MDAPRTAALVGTVGGAGTTRLCLELGAALAAAGRDVLVLDADLDAQGLARHVAADLDIDATSLLADPDSDLSDATVDYGLDAPGRLGLVPAHAPFVRVAAAKAPDAAERLEDRVAEATDSFDYVLVDTPPVASNPAVAAVTCTDRVALVFPGTLRGTDATARARGRLADVNAAADVLVATRTTAEDAPADADVAVPDAPHAAVGAAVAAPESALAAAAARTGGALFDADLDLADDADSRLDSLKRLV